jgi:putative ABC transport system substrate-binding protein
MARDYRCEISITRRRLVCGAGVALCFPLWARGQAGQRAHKLGIIVTGNNPRSAPFIAALEKRLADLGWVDGKNLTVSFIAGERRDELQRAVAALVASRVDVLVAAGPELSIEVAQKSAPAIPIVIVALNYDPVQKGYAESLARPGRNVTGVYFRNPEVGAKQVELLNVALPNVFRIGLLWTKYSADQVQPVEAVAARLRVQLEKVELRGAQDVARTFATFKERRVGAALALGDPIIYGSRENIADIAAKEHLPIVGQPSLAEAGALLGFGPDLNAAMAAGAEYADKILRGAIPATLPIDQPTKFILIVNLKTAKLLGIAAPQSLLLRADEVIQ